MKQQPDDETAAPVIEVSSATVAYRSYSWRPTSLKESIIRLVTRKGWGQHSTFNALEDVSFNITAGGVFGVIGSNGCGKSTLLKVLAGVLRPTSGFAAVRGEVASLIELGAGFDPELTAVENIYLHGSLHRRTRSQIKERVDTVLDFAELHEFAHTPVKYFSSGMYARLGFAAAVDICPDVLLVDEILAVGDERFQAKCMGVFERFIQEGRTIVTVSHDMGMIENWAKQVLLLERGHVRFLGDAKRAVEIYRESGYQSALG